MRLIAAMSGGVDSAVAAARAVDAGHDVTGIHLALSRNPAAAAGEDSAELTVGPAGMPGRLGGRLRTCNESQKLA